MMAARYSYPSLVEMYVISVTQRWLGALAGKFCSNKFGAIG